MSHWSRKAHACPPLLSLARKVERAVTEPKEEWALIHHEATTHDAKLGREWSKPTRVYDPIWSQQSDASELLEEEEREAQRYIFCSRAYMFDAIEPPRPRRNRSPSSSATPPLQSATPPLPAAMPARFRHAAQRMVPQLTDGSTNSTSSHNRLHGPTVQFLLPSAVLRGIVQDDDPKEVEANPSEDLMQVTCQVTNVSRIS